MITQNNMSRKMFVIFNILLFTTFSFICIVPFINILAVSFSSAGAAGSGAVKLWPVEFNLKSYEYVIQKPEFLRSLAVSFERVILGLIVNMFLTIITAYPLSKEKKDLSFRTVYVWVFVFTMLFSGGLIPLFIVVKNLKMIDSIWSLIIPGALPIFNAVLLLNFFRGLPKEMEESAFIDGAGHWTILWKIFIPTSIPALATLILFTIVGHWNSWFDGLVFMNSPKKYPLQTYMQTLIIQVNSGIMTQSKAKLMQYISDRTFKAAQIFIGALPVLLIYPFLQRYFMTGIILGSVKE